MGIYPSVHLQHADMVGYIEDKQFDDGRLANFLCQERGGWFCETACYFDNTIAREVLEDADNSLPGSVACLL
jgi:hypothetical protein